jgi:uncharacterized protein (TIGR02246 family)
MPHDTDAAAVAALVQAFVDGWNAGDGAACARPFAEDAEFTAITGLHATGRDLIARGHDEILRSIYRGTTIEGRVERVRFPRPDVALADVTFSYDRDGVRPFGIRRTSAGIVATREGGRWEIAAFRNMVPFERPAAGPLERERMPAAGASQPSPAPPTPAEGSAREPLVRDVGTARRVEAFGEAMDLMVSCEESGGQISAGFVTTPPGGGPPVHVHAHEDELFLVLEGQMQFYAGDRWVDAAPGTVAWLPRGVPHTFRNRGDVPSRHFGIATPGGFERFFAAAALAFAEDPAPSLERLESIARAYGITLVEEAHRAAQPA